MGQYFKAVILSPSNDKNQIIASFRAWDHDGNGAKITEHSWIGNYFVSTVEALLTAYGPYHRHRLVWAGDYSDPEPGMDRNLYQLAEANEKKGKVVRLVSKYKYLVNHSKQLYLDKTKALPDTDGWQVHPLPLLTAEGNIGESGDYHPSNQIQGKALGSWARDIVSVECEIPVGYTEQVISF